MIQRRNVVETILKEADNKPVPEAEEFAPANIALCKYWGKRDNALNLPITSSLSISLGRLGTRCCAAFMEKQHRIIFNGVELDEKSPFAARLTGYLEDFRSVTGFFYRIDTGNTIPTAAGFASSASGFAALIKALNTLHGWNLSDTHLSILARMGSGSACRSLWQGFAEWHAGERDDGMDSFAEPLPQFDWPELKIGLIALNTERKEIGSREAMLRTVETSALYKSWPAKVEEDMRTIRNAISRHDFDQLGVAAESNALAMHATMMASLPPILYWQPESVEIMRRVWNYRRNGMHVYFTMDAGPNLKLIFKENDRTVFLQKFPSMIIA